MALIHKSLFQRIVRRSHRYLGLFIGIQFLLWTIGGLYFSWSSIDEIHGDFERKNAPYLPLGLALVSPSEVIEKIANNADSLIEIKVINILGKPVYQVAYAMQHGKHAMKRIRLANAQTGDLRGALSQEEAIALAKSRFIGSCDVVDVQYITHTDTHHEYREQPLPAYAIAFEHPSQTVVYVATELGQITKFRNKKWRIFDFLWMFHTMDFTGRDNINNWLLRGFSILGLCTIFSGFLLFILSSKRHKK